MKNVINRLLAMIYKEFIHLVRDTEMRIIIIVVPLIQSIVFGYAVNMDLKYVETAIVDSDNTEESRALLGKFSSTDIFTLSNVSKMATAEEELLAGKATMVINIPKGFAKELSKGNMSAVQVIVDATNSVNAGMAAGYVNNIINMFNQDYATSKTPKGGFSGVSVRFRTWFNENFESRDFFIPSMLALLLMIVTVLLSSMAIVQEKEKGTLEQLIVSPITAEEFIIGKSIPFAIVSFFDVVLIILVAVFVFKINITGSLPLLLFASFLYILCTLGIGLLISAISSTQQQASMSMFMVIFPLILLSGFAFPIANMPKLIQYATYINPMRYYLDIIRGVFLKGLSVESLVPETLALTALGILYIVATVALLKRNLNN